MNHNENQEYSVNKLVKILLEESNSYTKEHQKSMIGLLIKKEGSLFNAIKKCDYTNEKLFELVIKKSKDINEEVLKAIKSVIDNNEGSLEKFIEREKDKSGKILFTFNDVKVSRVGKHMDGILYLTDKKISFIPQKIKYELNFFYIYVLPIFFFGGIGKIFGILGAGLGSAFGASLGGAFDYFFNKPKKVEQYDLPLTLQVAYVDGGRQIDLNNIKEVVVNGKKTRIVVMSNDKKQNCGFQTKKDDIEKIIDFLNKNNIQTRNAGNIISVFKNLRK